MIEKIKENKWLLIGAIFVFLSTYISLSGVDLTVGDDPSFRQYVIMGIPNFVGMRWNNWSSRFILEGILLGMLSLPVVIWHVITPLMFVLIYYSILKLIDKKKSLVFIQTVIIIIFSINFGLYGSAGWYATTINYVWVFGLGLYVLSFIPAILENKRIKVWQWLTITISALIATNQEQMCALIIGFYALTLLYYLIKNKRINVFLLWVCAISIIMLTLHVICPGNEIRRLVETSQYYPEYYKLSIFRKVYLGMLTTLAPMATTYILPIIIYLFIIMYLGLTSNNPKIRIVSIIPLIGAMLINFMFRFDCPALNQIVKYGSSKGDLIGVPRVTWIQIALILAMLIIFLLCIWITIKTCKLSTSIICGIILIAAFCSRVMMGFSPSVFASGERTFIFMYYLIYIDCLFLIKDKYSRKYSDD